MKTTVKTAMEHRNNINESTVYCKPIEGCDSGAVGKASEAIIHCLLSKKGFIVKPVQGAGKYDCICYVVENGKRKRVTVEVKTGRGEITPIMEKSDYIIYSYRPEKAANADEYTQQFVTLKTTDFLTILFNLNLIEVKKSTRGVTVKAIKNFLGRKQTDGSRPFTKSGREFLTAIKINDLSIDAIRGEK